MNICTDKAHQEKVEKWGKVGRDVVRLGSLPKMALEPGQLLDGKYRIVRRLSQGGMGTVYLGEHARIRRSVAIKVLHGAAAGSDDAVRRFEKEAQAAGRIGSDHIVEVLDLGNTPDDERFMVMEFLDGETLTSRIEQQPLTPHEVIPIVYQVLEGLAAAHKAQIVHRDLKPDNVFILKEKAGRRDFVKILDFGISKFNVLTGEEGSMTKTGMMLGTPFYMSPEQARTGQEVDHRSDLYSVGVIMYQAVTGRVPFEATTFAQLLFKIVFEVPPDPREFMPSLDPGFCALLMKAMAREQSARYQTAREFQKALIGFDGDAAGVAPTMMTRDPPIALGPAPGTARAASARLANLAAEPAAPAPVPVPAPSPAEPPRGMAAFASSPPTPSYAATAALDTSAGRLDGAYPHPGTPPPAMDPRASALGSNPRVTAKGLGSRAPSVGPLPPSDHPSDATAMLPGFGTVAMTDSGQLASPPAWPPSPGMNTPGPRSPSWNQGSDALRQSGNQLVAPGFSPATPTPAGGLDTQRAWGEAAPALKRQKAPVGLIVALGIGTVASAIGVSVLLFSGGGKPPPVKAAASAAATTRAPAGSKSASAPTTPAPTESAAAPSPTASAAADTPEPASASTPDPSAGAEASSTPEKPEAASGAKPRTPSGANPVPNRGGAQGPKKQPASSKGVEKPAGTVSNFGY
jgi:serine/threonine protein kinase